jgi:hypothetical protein
MSVNKRVRVRKSRSFETTEVAAILYLYFSGNPPAAIAKERKKPERVITDLIDGALAYAHEQLNDRKLLETLTILYAESRSGLTPLEIARKHRLNEADVGYLMDTLVDLLKAFLRTR